MRPITQRLAGWASKVGQLIHPMAIYISADLYHFVGRGLSPEDQYALLANIIHGGVLMKPGAIAHQWKSNVDFCTNDMIIPAMVSFCDIPGEHLEIHMGKYSHFGLGFSKTFLIQQGASPVLYVPRTAAVPANAWPVSSPPPRPHGVVDPYSTQQPPANISKCDYFNVMARMLHSALVTELFCTPNNAQNANQRERLSELSGFVGLSLMGQVKFFDPDLAVQHGDNYYMEREWRVLGLVTFTPDQLSRVVVPRSFARRLKKEFPNLRKKVQLVADPIAN